MNQLITKYKNLENKTFHGDSFSSDMDDTIMQSYTSKYT